MRILSILILFTLLSVTSGHVIACSMSVVTHQGKTFVGNNEDSWRTTPRIWFEPGDAGKKGACYVGNADNWPQGGMNIDGLVYDAFTMYPSDPPANGKPVAEDLKTHLQIIMQTCGTVEEVYAYADQFDRRNFDRAMMLFVDSTGKYLVMEADTMIIGSDEKFLLANFSFSRTSDLSTVTQRRYQRGRAFIQQHDGGGLEYCRALMDTMSECRAKMGDGTLYTSIFDVKDKMIYLYFYHTYDQVAAFSLEDELVKGAHWISMESLFAPNAEFKALAQYKTPAVQTGLLPIMFLFVVVLIIFAAGLTTQWFRQLHLAPAPLQYFRISLAVINALLAIFIWVIMNDHAVYYFPSPYTEPGRGWLNALSYLPFVLVAALVATVFLVLRKRIPLSRGGIVAYAGNAAIWICACVAFGYWGFYGIM